MCGAASLVNFCWVVDTSTLKVEGHGTKIGCKHSVAYFAVGLLHSACIDQAYLPHVFHHDGQRDAWHRCSSPAASSWVATIGTWQPLLCTRHKLAIRPYCRSLANSMSNRLTTLKSS